MISKYPQQYTIRVYGLILNEINEVLITDEFQIGMPMTKFPGGGMLPGEGTIDCLKREMMEECNQELEDIRHFYTTDFFQKALFFDDHQLISIYYLARPSGEIRFKVSNKAFDFSEMKNGNQSFRWISGEKLNPDDFTFPIDKHVAHLLKQHLNRLA